MKTSKGTMPKLKQKFHPVQLKNAVLAAALGARAPFSQARGLFPQKNGKLSRLPVGFHFPCRAYILSPSTIL